MSVLARSWRRILGALHVRSTHDQTVTSLGLASAVGEVVHLSDPRFDLSREAEGLRAPFDFILNDQRVVYFLEPYDSRRIPVLFIHDIEGTPRDFAPLIAKLDLRDVQLWVYFYPTGADLDAVAEHLSQLISKLRVRYDFKQLHVVGYSMGGLVSRAFIQKYLESTGRADVDLFVSIATPWGGDDLAALAVKHVPVVVHSWEEVASGSPFFNGGRPNRSGSVRIGLTGFLGPRDSEGRGRLGGNGDADPAGS